VTRIGLGALALACAASFAVPAHAEDFKIGSSVGLIGYISATDRAWRDGLQIAVDEVNGKGGIAGNNVVLLIEDNHSSPQDAVIGYKKLIASDKVNALSSGCFTAGNFAAGDQIAAAQLPFLTCGILPPDKPDQVKWMFGMRPLPAFELGLRMRYIKEKLNATKIGLLTDSTPYGQIQRKIALGIASGAGMEIVADESYGQDDPDLKTQIGKIAAAGAAAVMKIGTGPSTVTAAKNIKQLGLPITLAAAAGSLEDFKPAADVLGAQLIFVAERAIVADSMAPSPARDAAQAFLKLWNAKHAGEDASAAAYAYDSVMLIKAAAEKAGSMDGTAIRDGLQSLGHVTGAAADYDFTADTHVMTANPMSLAHIVDGKVEVIYGAGAGN
jgi:ABC-type branched-subunit amino acid transport system substrate-binding protein